MSNRNADKKQDWRSSDSSRTAGSASSTSSTKEGVGSARKSSDRSADTASTHAADSKKNRDQVSRR